MEKSFKLGDYIVGRLNEIKEKYDVIGDVRGLGSMIGLELVKDKKSKEPAPELFKEIINSCFKEGGGILINSGLLSDVIRFLAPLVMTKEQAEYGMNVLERAISKANK